MMTQVIYYDVENGTTLGNEFYADNTRQPRTIENLAVKRYEFKSLNIQEESETKIIRIGLKQIYDEKQEV